MDEDGFDEEILVDEDFTSAASGYFGGIRVPATLITGSSLGFLFALSKTTWDESSKGVKVLLRVYHASILIAFSLSLTTVIISTMASIIIMEGRHNPNAPNPYVLLRREFDYEFCVTFWCFLMSLLCFIVGVTCKVILVFGLLDPGKRYHLVSLLGMMVSLWTNMVSYVSKTLYPWTNLWEFTLHVVSLVWTECLDGHRPQLIVSMASAAISILCMIKLLFTFDDTVEDTSNKEKDD